MPKKDVYGRTHEVYPGGDISADEWEFLAAMDQYQRAHGRRFPAWREVLNVLKSLGYRKVEPPTALPAPPFGAAGPKPKPPAET